MIRMKHEFNGFTHADDRQDVERLKQYGWKLDDEPVKKEEPKAEAPKRGRPPKG